MYADDSKVGRLILCETDCLALHSDLDKLCVWSKNWQLRFNMNKCKILRLGKCNVNSIKDGCVLQSSHLPTGIWTDSSLKFSVHDSM